MKEYGFSDEKAIQMPLCRCLVLYEAIRARYGDDSKPTYGEDELLDMLNESDHKA